MSSKACYRPSAVRSGEVVRPLTGHGAPARCVAASTNELNSLQARERGAFKRVRATSSGSFYLCAARMGEHAQVRAGRATSARWTWPSTREGSSGKSIQRGSPGRARKPTHLSPEQRFGGSANLFPTYFPLLTMTVREKCLETDRMKQRSRYHCLWGLLRLYRAFTPNRHVVEREPARARADVMHEPEGASQRGHRVARGQESMVSARPVRAMRAPTGSVARRRRAAQAVDGRAWVFEAGPECIYRENTIASQ